MKKQTSYNRQREGERQLKRDGGRWRECEPKYKNKMKNKT